MLQYTFPGGPILLNAYLYPNDAPGLGIDIDERLAANFPLLPDMGQYRDGVVEWTQARLPDGSPARP